MTREWRILVAEDSVANQKVTLLFLKKLGYAADVAANGAEAVEALKRIPYDLVLMDCEMPDMDGFEATQKIRQIESSAKHAVIIAVTGLDDAGTQCRAAGMDDYLQKPIIPDQLKLILEKWNALPPAQTTAAVDPALIDERRLRLISGGDSEGLQYLLGVFVTQTESDLKALRAFIAERKVKEVYRVAHGMGGTCETYGVPILMASLRALEAMAKADLLTDAAPGLLDDAEKNFDRVRRVLRTYRLPLGQP